MSWFGLFHAASMLTLNTAKNIRDDIESSTNRFDAQDKGEIRYYDANHVERLVSNNHRCMYGATDYRTGHRGIMDLETYTLVEDWGNPEEEKQQRMHENALKSLNHSIESKNYLMMEKGFDCYITGELEYNKWYKRYDEVYHSFRKSDNLELEYKEYWSYMPFEMWDKKHGFMVYADREASIERGKYTNKCILRNHPELIGYAEKIGAI